MFYIYSQQPQQVRKNKSVAPPQVPSGGGGGGGPESAALSLTIDGPENVKTVCVVLLCSVHALMSDQAARVCRFHF